MKNSASHNNTIKQYVQLLQLDLIVRVVPYCCSRL